MSDTGNTFIGYEHKEMDVRRNMEDVYADNLPNFGWEAEGSGLSANPINVILRFKRNRRIANKDELVKLQNKFESHAHEIEKLEASKYITPSTVAYGIGIVGTAFMAGAVFSYLGSLIVPCVILAIPAFIGWIIPYFAFKRVKKNKTEKVTPIIDNHYEEIFDICKEANGLVHA